MHNTRLILIPRDLSENERSVVYSHELSQKEIIKREIIFLSRILAIYLAKEEFAQNPNYKINSLEAKFAFMDSAIEKQLKLLDQISSAKYNVDLDRVKINLCIDIEANRKYFTEINYAFIESIYINESSFITCLALEAQLLGFDLQVTRDIVNANFIRFSNIIKSIKAALPTGDNEVSEDEYEGKIEEPMEIKEYLLEILGEFFYQAAVLKLAKLNKLTYKI